MQQDVYFRFAWRDAQLACFIGEGANIWGEGSHDGSSETCLPRTATFGGLVGNLLGSSCLVPHLLM